MNTITSRSTLKEIMAALPASAGRFEKLGFDTCCGSDATLATACVDRGLDPETVLESLIHGTAAGNSRDSGDAASSMTPSELADHIQKVHHGKLWSELDRLDGLSAKVVRAHGEKDPRLALLREAFLDLAARFSEHMRMEEEVLFPLIRSLEAGRGPAESHGGSVANPIRAMEADHEEAEIGFLEMRQLTDQFRAPPWACPTYRALLDGLKAMELDLQVHVREESGLLFPAVLKLESGRRR